MPIHDYPEFSYHIVCLVPGSETVDEYLVLTRNMIAANAAFEAMVPERPGRIVLLMQKARIIRDSRELEPRMSSLGSMPVRGESLTKAFSLRK